MSVEYITTPPSATAAPDAHQRSKKETIQSKYEFAKYKLTTKDGWFGDYDFKELCLPQFPYRFGRSKAKERSEELGELEEYGEKRPINRMPPFYGLHDDLPLLLAIVAGFQHSLGMIAGLVTPPIIFANYINLDAETQSYMISASLVASGLLSMMQMSRIRLYKNYYLGTGLITVVGTSFATLSSAFAIFDSYYSSGKCSTTTAADGTVTKSACPDAYGALIGTSMLCSILEIGLSFVSAKKLKKLFPPIITGTVVFMIGAALIGDSGILNWAGGSNDCSGRPATGYFALCPNIAAPKPALWGSPQFIGLGFLSFITIVITEIFGSPFMRNASIVIGLIVGMIVAGPTGYVDGSSISTSPAITFLWVKTFKLSIYGPAILPMMAVYVTLAVEAIGDITASSEASRVEVEGEVFDSRIQGGVLSDGVAGLLAGAFTVSPMSIFAQNNGIIVLTRCANRRAGFFCASFIILYGVIGKISGVFLSIPYPVLGGVTTFLFASVATSGLRVLSMLNYTRRDRFILAASLSFGLGNLLVPTWTTYLFEGVTSTNAALQGFLSSLIIVVSTPYLSCGVIGVILNLILPAEGTEAPVDHVTHSRPPPPRSVVERDNDVDKKADEVSLKDMAVVSLEEVEAHGSSNARRHVV